MIIGISGKKGSGKDTLGNFIINNSCIIFEPKKFADKLKQVTSIMLNVPIEDCYTDEGKARYIDDLKMTNGQFQQKLGTDAIRNNIHEDAWAIFLFREYTKDKNWVVTDVRFENEASIIKHYGGILIRVNRDFVLEDGRDNNHPSETALDNYTEWDHIYDNNGSLNDMRAFVFNELLPKYQLIKKFSW